MKYLELLVCLAIATIVSAQEDNENETVELTLSSGKVRGSLMRSRLGRKIYSFRGMRYAEPPTGRLRFKVTVPVQAWEDVFDASEEGPACPQPGDIPKSEDCLRLNVYTTNLPSANPSGPKELRPVIVYFHHGGFYSASGQSFVVGPEYMMDQDVVLVTTNNRLGSLGFLSTDDSLVPANLGLKDQVESLQWIQKNIAAFGGDPDCVTISGYSVGGWSVSVHLFSPMSKGLFHRAIAMSGSVFLQEPLPYDQIRVARKQAELVGCPTDTTGHILDCLNTKSADEIANSLPGFAEWHWDPIGIWIPVVEPEVPGVERFLTAQPVDLIREGKFYDVPLITGVTLDEFGGLVLPIIEDAQKGNMSVLDDLNENWNKIAPISFLYERDTPRSNEISEALKRFYFKGKPIGLDNIEGLSHLYADSIIGFTVHRLVNLMSQALKSEVYYYKFTYQGRYSHATWSDTNKPFGVVHHDDLMYLFRMSNFPDLEKDDPEIAAVERLTSMWAHFAKTGQPIPCDNDKFNGVTWTPFTVENQKYLEIGDELTMKTNLYTDRMNEWERLFGL